MRKILLLTGAVGLGAIAVPALADRAPTEKELAEISTKLKAEGFVSWEEVELDDDGPYWEIDDARTGDGKRYDLKLRPGTLEIFDRDLED